MKRQKTCEYCGTLYTIPKNVSSASWKQRKFCTTKCKTLASRGKPSWNKGKGRPYTVTPAYREKMRKIALARGYGRWMKGKKASAETIAKRTPKISGAKHYAWKGGKRVGSDGYVLVYAPNHPHKQNNNSVREHRLVAEKKLGRYLKPTEVVHHINGNKQDNNLENLYLFKNDHEHHAHHRNSKTLESNLLSVR